MRKTSKTPIQTSTKPLPIRVRDLIKPDLHLEQKDGEVQATKHDGDKVDFTLVPQLALLAVARVFTKGARKYKVGNWFAGKGFKWLRLAAASERHGFAWRMGEDLDQGTQFKPGTQEHHLANRICCDMMLLENILRKHGEDDRGQAQPIHLKPHTSIQLPGETFDRILEVTYGK